MHSKNYGADAFTYIALPTSVQKDSNKKSMFHFVFIEASRARSETIVFHMLQPIVNHVARFLHNKS
jgi:hypothetical protein